MNLTDPHSGRPQRAATLIDRLARRVFSSKLAGMRRGQITLEDPAETQSWGERADLQATLQIHDSRVFRRMILGGSIGAAESYIRGDWDCDDLTALFRLFLRNRGATDRLDAGLATVAGWWHRLYHGWHGNTRRGSRENIAAHYDLGNDFYRLWLDETWAYSCGVFPAMDSSLRDASREKFDRVCRKLDLLPEDHLLEIGSGWGGFAIHAAGEYGCRVTTTTISAEQARLARQHIADAGLCDRVQLLTKDYRDLAGSFHKLASIEMIEAVGHRFLDTFFRQCARLLRPDGALVLQAIVMPEQTFDRYRKSVDFIQRYVFPGGCLPSVGAILKAVARTGDLQLMHLEDFSAHYAETLRRWRLAFRARLNDLRAHQRSESFLRLWEYYLCYCEAAFEERAVGVVQLRLDKPGSIRDPIALARRVAQVHLASAADAAATDRLAPSFIDG